MERRSSSGQDWANFGDFIQKQWPFQTAHSWFDGFGPDNDRIRVLVQELVADWLKFPFGGSQSEDADETGIDYEMLETADTIRIRCALPEGTSEGEMKVYANRRKLRIERGEKQELINLPCDIVPYETIVKRKDEALIIVMRKSGEDQPFHEILTHP